MTSRLELWCGLLTCALLAASSTSCARRIRPYSIEGPVWRDEDDFTPFVPRPSVYYSPAYWDGADNMVFRPTARVFAFDPGGEAINVNSMDEVPDSSWFENRLTKQWMSPERVARGACGEYPLDPSGPWTITSAKPDGAYPGFVIKDQRGRTYLLKFDDDLQRERSSAGDVIGSIIYWAAGYHAPCNEVVYFEEDILQLSENATEKVYGKKVPLTWERLEPMFAKREVEPDGTIRAMASRFVEGKPLGPWRYESVRDDDPNDIVPHEDRRELRGAYVLASWISHVDSREQNSLSTWVTAEGSSAGYVRHNIIDFGDAFGNWSAFTGIPERYGHTYYFDATFVLQDFVTFGAIPRPWRDAELGPTGHVLAYYDVKTFEPDKFKTGYQNPAFIRATERDKAWMTRIVAKFTPEVLQAVLAQAQVKDPLVHSELTRILLGRREKILRRWFRNLSPLTDPTLRQAETGTEVCLEDLALATGIVDRKARLYGTRGWYLSKHSKPRDVRVESLRALPDNVICVLLPDMKGASPDRPAYLIVDVLGFDGQDDDHSRPARVHVYQRGPRAYVIAGLQRPYKLRTPNGKDQHYPRSLALVRLAEF